MFVFRSPLYKIRYKIFSCSTFKWLLSCKIKAVFYFVSQQVQLELSKRETEVSQLKEETSGFQSERQLLIQTLEEVKTENENLKQENLKLENVKHENLKLLSDKEGKLKEES